MKIAERMQGTAEETRPRYARDTPRYARDRASFISASAVARSGGVRETKAFITSDTACTLTHLPSTQSERSSAAAASSSPAAHCACEWNYVSK